jgi:hypothetical protein
VQEDEEVAELEVKLLEASTDELAAIGELEGRGSRPHPVLNPTVAPP